MGAARKLLAILLVAAGLSVAAFYGLLLGIADCGPACVARGERLVPVALIALGAGLATGGVFAWRLDARRAAGWGLSVAGLALGIGAILLFAQGSRGPTAWAIGLGLLAILAGGAMRRPPVPRA